MQFLGERKVVENEFLVGVKRRSVVVESEGL